MPKILNSILCTVMIFLLTFSWTAYCLREVKLALILAAVVALCGCYLIIMLLSQREDKKQTKQKEKKTVNSFGTFLQFNADNAALFSEMFRFYRYEVEPVDFDNVVLSKDNRCFAAICFQESAVTLAQIQKAVVSAKRNGCNKLIVFGNKMDNALQTVANTQLPTKFVDLANTYALFEKAEKLPQFENGKTVKQHIIPQFAFNKKRFGWYFGGALFMLLTSFVSLLKIYLLVWSTVLFGLAMYSLCNKRYNKIPTDVTLE